MDEPASVYLHAMLCLSSCYVGSAQELRSDHINFHKILRRQ